MLFSCGTPCRWISCEEGPMDSLSTPGESSSVLCELLRRTLSLVEYYGRLETDEASLFELKLALVRTIERLEYERASRAADRGREYELPSRKQPQGEGIDTNYLERELHKKP